MSKTKEARNLNQAFRRGFADLRNTAKPNVLKHSPDPITGWAWEPKYLIGWVKINTVAYCLMFLLSSLSLSFAQNHRQSALDFIEGTKDAGICVVKSEQVKGAVRVFLANSSGKTLTNIKCTWVNPEGKEFKVSVETEVTKGNPVYSSRPVEGVGWVLVAVSFNIGLTGHKELSGNELDIVTLSPELRKAALGY